MLTFLNIQFSIKLSQFWVNIVSTDMTFLLGKYRYCHFIWSTFQLHSHFPLHLWGCGGLHYVSPRTKKLSISSRHSICLKLWRPTHTYFFSLWKMGMIKVQRKSFPVSLYISTVCAHYLLSTVQAVVVVIIIYILNKQEITEIPHLSLQPWPRPGALDNECN